MAREPVLWCNRIARHREMPAKRFNPATGYVEQLIDQDTGLPLIEKLPQPCHEGNSDGSDDNPALSKLPGWLHVLKQCGSEVRMRTLMGAADIEGQNHVRQERLAKVQYFGWIPVGTCPLAMIIAGTLRPEHLACEDLKAPAMRAQACDALSCGEYKPCPHYLLEEKARKLRHARTQKKRIAGAESEAEKIIRAQQEQNRQIVADVGQSVGAAMAQAFERFSGAGGTQLTPEAIAAIVASTVQALKEPAPAAPPTGGKTPR